MYTQRSLKLIRVIEVHLKSCTDNLEAITFKNKITNFMQTNSFKTHPENKILDLYKFYLEYEKNIYKNTKQ